MQRLERVLIFITFLSGASSLIYQTLWVKQLGHILGSAATTGAAVLAAFFLGLALGSFAVTRFVHHKAHIGVYARLEWGIAAGAVLFWVLHRETGYSLAGLLGGLPSASIWQNFTKFITAGFLVWIPSFFMGGTLPVLIAVLSQKNAGRGGEGKLYAWNTIGALTGTGLGAFILPPLIGYSATYAVAVAINIGLALWCSLLNRKSSTNADRKNLKTPSPLKAVALLSSPMAMLAFLSGFGSLALETLWHKMFSLVTINCVYSFAVVLITFLLGLSIGAPIANKVKSSAGHSNLKVVLWFAAFFIIISPWLFFYLSDGFSYLYAGKSWGQYVITLLGLCLAVILLPTILFGIILPYVLRTQGGDENSGGTAGLILGLNTLGGILGALCGGFLLSRLSTPLAVAIVALVYIGAALMLEPNLFQKGRRLRHVASLAGVCVCILWIATAVPSYRSGDIPGEKTMAVYHGPHGVLTVSSVDLPIDSTRRAKDLFIRLNNFYTLGGIGSLPSERRQGELPLFLAESARSVFMVGMGTGITAGATLNHPIESLHVSELVPDVVKAAKEHFSPYTGNLFKDSRVHIYEDDGSNILAMNQTKYDVIISDLFDPWGASTGRLFSLENFELMKSRLTPMGIFVQWLPLYQLTEEGFGIVAKTMLSVFPQVVAWRGNFDADKPILALIGFEKPAALQPSHLEARILARGQKGTAGKLAAAEVFLTLPNYAWQFATEQQKKFYVDLFPHIVSTFPYGFYAGNLTMKRDRFSKFPTNTQDNDAFSYSTPRSLGLQKSGDDIWLTQERLVTFLDSLKVEDDPYLKNLSKKQLEAVQAGEIYLEYAVARYAAQNDPTQAIEARILFESYKEKARLLH